MHVNGVNRQLIVVLFFDAYTACCMAQSLPLQSKHLPSWAPDSSCIQEFEETTQPSAVCKEQLVITNKHIQEESKKCTDAMQIVLDICGIGKNAKEECYKKYRPDLSAACGGM